MSALPIEADIAAVARIGAVPTILRVIREITGLRFTLVARVTGSEWVACAVHDEINFGLGVGGKLDIATTLCREVRNSLEPVAMDHASEDPHYCNHPTPKMYGFESYIAVPLYRNNGEFFGTVCGLDPHPNQVNNDKTLSMMHLFAELISLQLQDEERHARGRAELVDEQAAAELREQFIAVLGHDVRNPLASLGLGVETLARASNADPRLLERMRSSVRRIGGLVEDVLDLARGRLGGGIPLGVREVTDLEARLRHVVTEVESAHPGSRIELVVVSSASVHCDRARIEQLLSNLLANAIQHGSSGAPVEVTMDCTGEELVLLVRNRGTAIPRATLERLFQPYFRGGRRVAAGLGLGLYIVSEIAKAHRGAIEVTSTDEGTTFRFAMPRGA